MKPQSQPTSAVNPMAVQTFAAADISGRLFMAQKAASKLSLTAKNLSIIAARIGLDTAGLKVLSSFYDQFAMRAIKVAIDINRLAQLISRNTMVCWRCQLLTHKVGGVLNLNSLELQFIPAHYLHSSGNFHVYDGKPKILFSGDIGAALEPVDSWMFVEDFELHANKMRYFHQRWMPSETAKLDWLERVIKLGIDMMYSQHGRIFVGQQVTRFFDWFENCRLRN